MNTYDLVIIGGGPGGYTAALKAAKLGMKVAVVESERLGGNCINRGCIPTKALLHAASVYTDMKNRDRFGLLASQVGFDFSRMQAYKEETVDAYRATIQEDFDREGVELIMGHGTLHGNRIVEVNTEDKSFFLQGNHVILAAGSRPIIPDIPGIALPGVYTSRQILGEREWKFDSLTIIGGGIIGVEFATIFSELGAKVTLVEQQERLLAKQDELISGALKESLEAKGVEVLCGAVVESISREEKLAANIRMASQWRQVVSDAILISVGRKPRMQGLLAEDAGVDLENGLIRVSDEFKTSAEGVFAVGDLVSRIQLAHVAAAQGTYVVEKIAGMAHGTQLSVVPNGMFVVLPVVPNCIYTNPEIATVGITEATAHKYHMKVKCGQAFMDRNGKSIICRENGGFIRLIFEAYSNTLVGAQMMCPRATDMIGEMATAISNGLTAFQLTMAMRAHPTYSETIALAIEDAMRG